MPADGAGKHDFLEVAAFADKVFDGIAVGDAHDILLDDGAVVEDFGDVVAGGADELDAALEGLVVRARANEGRQKRMMDVDDALRIAADEIVGKNLHVTGEHQEISLAVFDQRMDLFFGLSLIFFGDGNDTVRNLVKLGNGLVVGVVGNDQRDVAGEFAALVTVEKIDETVIVF